MLKYSYFIIAAILLIVIIIYYILQRPKTEDLKILYEKYLLSASSPATAFTHAKLSDNLYENYYFDVTDEGSTSLVRYADPYPITSTGAEYVEKEHGAITETDTGFNVLGVETSFNCPVNWSWSTSEKKCKPDMICGENDASYIKGINLYQFNALEQTYNKPSLREVNYHDRIYAFCLDNSGSYELRECLDNTIYNNKDRQEGTLPVCEAYDICTENPDYTKHKKEIDGYILKNDEYYMCFNSKSELQKCSPPLIFNSDLLSCMATNKCSGKPDGYTFNVDEKNYILCNNQQEYTIYCPNNIYTDQNTGLVSCTISTNAKFFNYFSNALFSYPISAYTYKDNVQIENNCPDTFSFFEHLLPPQTETVFALPKNKNLYEPIKYQDMYIKYETSALDVAIIEEITRSSIQQFMPNYLVEGSYHSTCLPSLFWNYILQRPDNQYESKYYKFDDTIKSFVDDSIIGSSLDYVTFITSDALYTTTGSITKTDTDIASGINVSYNAKIPSTIAVSGLRSAYLIALIRTPKFILMPIINHTNDSAVLIEWSPELIIGDAYLKYEFNRPISKKFNLTIPTIEANFYSVQFSSILWYKDLDRTDYIVRPQCLLCVNFTRYKELANKFNIVVSVKLNSILDIDTFFEQSILKHTQKNITPTFTGDSSYFETIAKDIQTRFLTKAS